MKKIVLVTGGTGLLGAHLLYRLTNGGQPVRAVYRNPARLELTRRIFGYYTDEVETLWQKIDWVQLDLEDVTAVWQAIKGVQQVYHCAALVSFDAADTERLWEVNLTTTANVVNACLEQGVGKLLHVSSVAALGRGTEKKVIDENSHWTDSEANTAYAKSKYQSELEVWRATQEGLPAVIVNPSIILGPGDWKRGSGKLFHTIDSGFKFYTRGVNAYVDVRDVARAMTELMHSDISNERFVLAAENLEYKEIFELIAKELGVKAPTIHAKPWMGNVVWRLEKLRSLFGGTANVTRETAHTAHQVNRYSSEKITERIGFQFTALEESVRDFAKLYRKEKA